MGTEPPEAPDERYRGERAGLLRQLPPLCRRVLLIGAGNGALGYLLKKGGTEWVHGIETEPEQARLARALLDAVSEEPPETVLESFAPGSFNAVVVADAPADAAALDALLARVRPTLEPRGRLLLLLRNPRFWRMATAGAVPRGLDAEETRTLLTRQGFEAYNEIHATDDAFLALAPTGAGHVHVDGQAINVGTEAGHARMARIETLVIAVHRGYDPLAHARALIDAGRADWAYDLLARVPESRMADPESACAHHTAMLHGLEVWMAGEDEAGVLPFFVRAQQHFYDAVALCPEYHPAYQHMAGCWVHIGGPARAAGLLRSVHHVSPDVSVEAQLSTLELPTPSPLVEAPAYERSKGPFKILFVMHPRFHYGLDVLFDGLCTVLGPDNVVDFPFKPSLHGEHPAELDHYPCRFDWPGEAYSLDEIAEALEARHFDAVLYGDCEKAFDRQTAQRIATAAGTIPLFLVDALDECTDFRSQIIEHTGFAEIAGYFKREMLACWDYGPDTFPLPFAYPDARVPETPVAPRTQDLFWAGHRNGSLRRLYLESLEARLGVRLDNHYDQEGYVRALRNARIALNCFGFGFDTVRYWEVPAHGAMLLSEPPPIVIPHNFRDSVSAVFFEDAAALDEKLDYYIAHPEECEAIASAGHEWLLQHHTASARARQLLAWIQSSC